MNIKDSNAQPETEDHDIIRLSTPKKENVPSPVAATAMPVIDEDKAVLEGEGKSNQAKEDKPTGPKTPILFGRRKRAVTVGAEEDTHANTAPIQHVATAPTSQQGSPLRPITAYTASPEQKPDQAPRQNPNPAITETRKRTNTIVGIFRAANNRRPNEDQDAETDKLGSEKTTGGEDVDKPRSLRFTFNSNTTSSKAPDEIMVEIVRCCNKLGVPHRLITRYLLECNPVPTGKEPLKMEIEVCKLPRLNNLHGLRFKRVGGSSSEYKELSEKILATIHL
jgi:MAP/microtubule affinity-regulating kinase